MHYAHYPPPHTHTQYSSIDNSPLSKYVMHPFWNSVVKVGISTTLLIVCASMTPEGDTFYAPMHAISYLEHELYMKYSTRGGVSRPMQDSSSVFSRPHPRAIFCAQYLLMLYRIRVGRNRELFPGTVYVLYFTGTLFRGNRKKLVLQNFRRFNFREWPSTHEIRDTKSTTKHKTKLLLFVTKNCEQGCGYKSLSHPPACPDVDGSQRLDTLWMESATSQPRPTLVLRLGLRHHWQCLQGAHTIMGVAMLRYIPLFITYSGWY